jgi:hypothetical protein
MIDRPKKKTPEKPGQEHSITFDRAKPKKKHPGRDIDFSIDL